MTRLRLVTALLLTLPGGGTLKADGGALQLRQQAGGFLVSVFTLPPVPRAGSIDFSILLQRPGTLDPVLDAQVEVIARDRRGVTVSRAALHEQAQNRLFYAAVVNLSHEGIWRYEISIRQGSARAEATGSMEVYAANSPLIAHWRELSFAPALLLLFALHQRLSMGRLPETEFELKDA